MNTIKLRFDEEELRDPFEEPTPEVKDKDDELSDDADEQKTEEEELI
jgi:hypothetical protein